MAGLSLRCGDCGVQLRSVEEAQAHAEATSHANFSESTEAVLNLICADCGKPCRSQTRTGHADFTDKTMEAAKPIDLKVRLKPPSEAMDVDASASGEPQEMVVPEVNKEMLAELESMGFSTARATRALHFSGNSTIEGAINWLSEHQGNLDIEEMPQVPVNTKTEANKPSLTPEEKKIKAQELRERACKKKEEEEKRMEREREKLMGMSGPRWKKGKDGKDFAAVAAANPMSKIVAELQASLRCSKLVATLCGQVGDAILVVKPEQSVLLNRAAFGRAVENAGAEKQWFQLGPEEVLYLCHALKCITVESENKKQMSEGELWDCLTAASESFPEMYRAYSHLRSKNWVVRSGLQYGADFVAYHHHPALVHSEFAVVVVPEGVGFGGRCGRLKVWSDLLCALRASGSVAKTLLVLTISSSGCELSSPDCLEQLVVHERTVTRWIPKQCREQRCEPCREEANREVQDHKSEKLVFNHWGVILGFTVLSSLLVYKLKL